MTIKNDPSHHTFCLFSNFLPIKRCYLCAATRTSLRTTVGKHWNTNLWLSLLRTPNNARQKWQISRKADILSLLRSPLTLSDLQVVHPLPTRYTSDARRSKMATRGVRNAGHPMPTREAKQLPKLASNIVKSQNSSGCVPHQAYLNFLVHSVGPPPQYLPRIMGKLKWALL